MEKKRLINIFNSNNNKKKKEGIKMKLLIEKNIILESLSNVMRAISPRNIIPILNGVLFELTE